MADIGAIVLIIMMILFVIGIPILFLIIRYWKFPVATETLVICEDTSKTGGSGIGNLIKKKVGKDGRVIIEMLPRDILNPKPIRFAEESEKIITLPKGVWLKDKNVIRILPNSSQEWLANMFNKVEEINASIHISKGQREGLDRQQGHLMAMGEGELSKQRIGQVIDTIHQINKSQSSKIDKLGKPGTYASSDSTRDSFM